MAGLTQSTGSLFHRVLAPHCDFIDGAVHVRSPTRLIAHLERTLLPHSDEAERFVNELRERFGQHQSLRTALDSPLFSVLLAVQSTQSMVECWLLECLGGEGAEWLRFEGIDSTATIAAAIPAKSLVRRVLGTLTQCDVHYDPNKLIELSLSVLTAAEPCIARELSLSLPCLIPAIYHHQLIGPLMDFVKDPHTWHTMALPILDALSSFDMHDYPLDSVIDTVISRIQSVQPRDLPVLIRCLANAAREQKEQIAKFAGAIRRNFDVSQSPPAQSVRSLSLSSKDAMDVDASRDDASVSLLIATQLFRAFEQSTPLVKQLIEDLSSPSIPLTSHDFAMLCLLHAATLPGSSTNKRILVLIITAVTDGRLDPATIEVALPSHSAALSPWFESLTSMAFELMQSKSGHEKLARASRACYCALFVSFGVRRVGQHVAVTSEGKKLVTQLLEHCQSPGRAERLHGLQCLSVLASRGSLHPYWPQLFALNESIEDYTIDECRTIAEIVASVNVVLEEDRARSSTFNSQSSACFSLAIRDKFSIFIRKQLFATFAFQRVGVLFTVAAIERAAKLHEEKRIPFSPRTEDQVRELLNRMREAHQNHLDLLAFILDELSRVLQREPAVFAAQPMLLNDLHEQFTVRIESDQVLALAAVTQLASCDSHQPVRVQPRFALEDGGQFTEYAVNIAPSLQSNERDHTILLAPLLRLTCTRQQLVGQLDEIAALLYSPLALISQTDNDQSMPDFVASQPRPVQVACVSGMVHGVNWLRELISRFTDSREFHRQLRHSDAHDRAIPDIGAKLLTRLESLIELEKELRSVCGVVDKIEAHELLGFAGINAPDAAASWTRLVAGAAEEEGESHKYTKLQKKPIVDNAIKARKVHVVPCNDSESDWSGEDEDETSRKKKKQASSAFRSSSPTADRWLHTEIEPLLRAPSLVCIQLLQITPSRALTNSMKKRSSEAQSSVPDKENENPQHDSEGDEARSVSASSSVSESDGAKHSGTTLSPRGLFYLLHTVLLAHTRSALAPSAVSHLAKRPRTSAVVSDSKLSPAALLTALIPSLPSIGLYWRALIAGLKEKVSEVDNPWHQDEGIEAMRDSLVVILQTVKLIIENEAIEAEAGGPTLLLRTISELTGSSESDAWSELFERFRSSLACLPEAGTIAEAALLMARCIDRGRLDATFRSKISKTSAGLLASDWAGDKTHKGLGAIVAVHARFAASPVESMMHYAKAIGSVSKDEGQPVASILGESFSKTRAPLLLMPLIEQFTAAFTAFSRALKDPSAAAIGAPSQWPTDCTGSEKTWLGFCELFSVLLSAAREFPKNTRLLTRALDAGVKCVRTCTSALPALCQAVLPNAGDGKRALVSTTTRFNGLIAPVSAILRSVTIIAEHGSSARSSSMLRFAPSVKRACESWLWTLKQQAKKLGCSDSFSEGMLKLRDIKGNEILSQREPAESIPSQASRKRRATVESRTTKPRRKRAKRERLTNTQVSGSESDRDGSDTE